MQETIQKNGRQYRSHPVGTVYLSFSIFDIVLAVIAIKGDILRAPRLFAFHFYHILYFL
jgi:hypothetical protein